MVRLLQAHLMLLPFSLMAHRLHITVALLSVEMAQVLFLEEARI
jgi:hypothetical protein